MPLPLGHIAIGLAVNDLVNKKSSFTELKVAVYVAVLANLPDVDVVLGILLQGNGSAFHRGPTHSMLFAFLAGIIAAKISKFWGQIPQLGFINCFVIILSHITADFFFTESPVSFLWPLEVNWVGGYSGLQEVLIPVFLDAHRDAVLILVCLLLIGLNRAIARMSEQSPFTFPAYRAQSLRKDSEE